ncbi:MAG TPA: succinate dehydrogenase, hydrophobic membrane anchor protein [Steroidobacteraceae bacterium]|nr:succinate dehydrogenase, hydrophobic membrane anchor protein [Steroidobacteraceae bacterium]
MSLSSPLRQVLGAGPARSGVHHWWLQRLTSLALVPLSVWLLVSLLALPALDHLTVRAWLAHGWTALLMILLVLLAAWHSQLGLQVIIEDYLHQSGPRWLLLVLTRFANVLLAAAGVFAVLRVAVTAAA